MCKKWYAIPNPGWPGGKWRIDINPCTDWCNFNEIAYVAGEENARLIASAPEMKQRIGELETENQRLREERDMSIESCQEIMGMSSFPALSAGMSKLLRGLRRRNPR